MYGYAVLVSLLLATGLLLRFPSSGERLFAQMRDLLRYYVVGVCLFPMAAAAWSVFIILSVMQKLERFPEIWFLATPCFAAAIVLLTPFLAEAPAFLRAERALRHLETRRLLLFCSINLLLAALLWSLLPEAINRLPALVFCSIPLLVLSALRLTPFGMSATFLISMVPAILVAVRMDLPNRTDIGLVNMQILQWSIIATGFLLHSLSIVAQSHRTAQARLSETAALAIARQEEERANVSRELHDSIGQRIALAAFTLGNLPADGRSETRDSIEGVRSDLLDVLDEVRDISLQLHPSAISHAGLTASLQSLAGEIAGRWHGRVELDLAPIRTTPDAEASLQLFRVAQEAAHNAISHGDPAVLLFRLGEDSDGIYLEVADDGRGFEPHAPPRTVGLGLISMRERCRRIGAVLEIVSNAQGGGTRVCVRLPQTP